MRLTHVNKTSGSIAAREIPQYQLVPVSDKVNWIKFLKLCYEMGETFPFPGMRHLTGCYKCSSTTITVFVIIIELQDLQYQRGSVCFKTICKVFILNKKVNIRLRIFSPEYSLDVSRNLWPILFKVWLFLYLVTHTSKNL